VGESMNGPWSESRDAGNPHVRFDERDLETGPSRSPRQISTLPSQSAREIFALWSRSEAARKGNWIKLDGNGGVGFFPGFYNYLLDLM
jgi:hypothetical protein